MQEIFQVVAYLHSSSMSHRDLRHEVFVFAHSGPIENNTLKLMDLSRTRYVRDENGVMTILGCNYFTAPEAWGNNYTQAIDLWSCGVIMFCLLCGYLPFDGEDHKKVVKMIQEGDYEFNIDWECVSNDAKDLVTNLLKVNHKERFTAEEALQHVWVAELAPNARCSSFGEGFFQRLCQGPRSVNAFKQAALHLIRGSLSGEQVQTMREMFQSVDKNGDGYISVAEIEDAIATHNLPDNASAVLRQNLSDWDGCINFSEFVALSMDRSQHLTTELLEKAFCQFDLNGDGLISSDELHAILGNSGVRPFIAQTSFMPHRSVEEVFKEINVDKSGYIKFAEFKQMMLNSGYK